MEPNILTRRLDPTIKGLQEENAQLKSELKRLQEIEKEHCNLNGSLRKRINDAIDFIDNIKVVSYESDEVYCFKEIPEGYDLWNILYEEDESPYCEVCGHCGEIGCCGIKNFLSEHVEGKTNCKNEDVIIQEIIDLCEYKDDVFDENKKLKEERERQEKAQVILDNQNADLFGRINEAVDILKLCNSQCAKETINILTGENND